MGRAWYGGNRVDGRARFTADGHALFFVQEYPRGVWHVESREDPETMLCGLKISIDSDMVKIQRRFGLKPCLWCKRWLDDGLFSSPFTGSTLPSTKTKSAPDSTPRLRLVTTSTGRGSREISSHGRASTDGGSLDGG